MTHPITRRNVLRTGAAAAGCALAPRLASASPKASVESVEIISKRPHLYHGWPTLARRRSGELLLVCSGGREWHVCPFGRVELMRSRDGGKSWSWPRVLIDTAIDDRDAGVCETPDGSLLATTFTSLAYQDDLRDAKPGVKGRFATWTTERIQRWKAAHHRTTAAQREGMLGNWMIRSTDGGVSWSAPYRVPVNSPHGPVALSDGRVIYAGKRLWHKYPRIGVADSSDNGATWRWLAEIPTRPGDTYEQYHELHITEAANGRLIAHMRNHNKANERETLQSESADGGRTWTIPHSIGVWGLPSHLLRLDGGRLLMTYGHRRKPYGNQARVSDDNGQSWSEPVVLSGDGHTGDLGYPSTVQLGDGTLLTVWYELMEGSRFAVLRQARWQLTV